jgi:hypothetical protein
MEFCCFYADLEPRGYAKDQYELPVQGSLSGRTRTLESPPGSSEKSEPDASKNGPCADPEMQRTTDTNIRTEAMQLFILHSFPCDLARSRR